MKVSLIGSPQNNPSNWTFKSNLTVDAAGNVFTSESDPNIQMTYNTAAYAGLNNTDWSMNFTKTTVKANML